MLGVTQTCFHAIRSCEDRKISECESKVLSKKRYDVHITIQVAHFQNFDWKSRSVVFNEKELQARDVLKRLAIIRYLEYTDWRGYVHWTDRSRRVIKWTLDERVLAKRSTSFRRRLIARHDKNGLPDDVRHAANCRFIPSLQTILYRHRIVRGLLHNLDFWFRRKKLWGGHLEMRDLELPRSRAVWLSEVFSLV